MTVNHEAGNAFGGFRIERHEAGDAAIGNPHLGSGHLPVVVPGLTGTDSNKGNIVKRRSNSVPREIPKRIGAIGLVIVLVEENLRGRGVIRPAIVGAAILKNEPPGIQKSPRHAIASRSELIEAFV